MSQVLRATSNGAPIVGAGEHALLFLMNIVKRVGKERLKWCKAILFASEFTFSLIKSHERDPIRLITHSVIVNVISYKTKVS